jgi:hypothetical protein
MLREGSKTNPALAKSCWPLASASEKGSEGMSASYYVGDHIHWSLPNGNEGEGEIVRIEETPDGTEFFTIKMWLDDYEEPQYETVRDDNVDGLASGYDRAPIADKHNPSGRCIGCKTTLGDEDDFYLCRVCKYTL